MGEEERRCGRRMAVLGVAGALATLAVGDSAPATAAENTGVVGDVESLQAAAIEAFSGRDFAKATAALKRLTALEPENPSWHEALGQCYTDGDRKSVV